MLAFDTGPKAMVFYGVNQKGRRYAIRSTGEENRQIGEQLLRIGIPEVPVFHPLTHFSHQTPLVKTITRESLPKP